MNPISLTGNLSLWSTNGDGPQLLKQAAEFVQALAAMGVMVGVEINLRPVVDGAPAPLAPLAPAVPPAPTNPTTAAPSATGEPRTWNLEPKPRKPPGYARANDWQTEQTGWRNHSQAERRARFEAVVRNLAAELGRPPTQAEYNERRPRSLATATAIMTTLYDEPWKTVMRRFGATTDSPSGA